MPLRKGNRKRKAFCQQRNRFATLRAFHFAASEKWGKWAERNWASQTKELRKGKHEIALATHGAYPARKNRGGWEFGGVRVGYG